MKKSFKYMFGFALLLLPLLTAPVFAQSPAVRLLIQKADSLEGRGRSDLAAQIWHQILTTDPNQQDALAGLARDARRDGKSDQAAVFLARLRKVNPHHPALAELEGAPAVPGMHSKLDEAAHLAATQHYEQAVTAYRQVFGDNPPPGEWAIAYYEAEASLPGGWEKATAALRDLSQRYPAVDDYKLSLARLLTYRPKTRAAGIAMLQDLSERPALAPRARLAWKQALLWDKSNPAALPSIHQFLKKNQDAELKDAADGLVTETHRSEAERPTPGGHEGLLGYQALKAGNLAEAEKHFNAALALDPKNSAALSGMGYLRLKQQDFASAATFLRSAKEESPRNRSISEALATAQFWLAMGDATKALDGNDLDRAKTSFNEALALRPNNPDAELGAAGVALRAKQYTAAEAMFQKLVSAKPDDVTAWRGLVSARYQGSGARSALETLSAMPKPVAENLNSTVGFLALRADIYADSHEETQARAAFKRLMEFVSNRLEELPRDQRVQVAGLMVRYGQSIPAAASMRRLVEADNKNLDAWEVLLGALVQQKRQKQALASLQQIPDDVYNDGLRKPSFLRMVASIEAENGKLAEAEDALTKLYEADKTAKTDSWINTSLELARVYQQEGRADRAESLLSELLEATPDEPDVWRAYASILHDCHRDAEAISLISRMPRRVMQHLMNDPDYISTLAAAQIAMGDSKAALRLVRDGISAAAEQGGLAPVRLQNQLAWMLLNIPESAGELYSLLEQTGHRPDLTPAEEKETADIWTTWILRTAESASASGDDGRALAILQQGSRMLPGEGRIKRSLAGNLLKAGDNARALKVYKNWGLHEAEATDYAGAIGAAMSQHDTAYVNTWLNEGLSKFPQSPEILNIAGKEAAGRRDYKRAQYYWKEALAVTPQDKKEMRDLLAANPGMQEPPRKVQSMRNLLLAMPSDEPPVGSAVVPEKGISSLRKPKEQSLFALAAYQQPPVSSQDIADHPAESNPFAEGNRVVQPESLMPAEGNSLNSAAAIQDEVDSVNGRNTPYIGTEDSVQSRNGTAGYDRMILEQADIQASTTIGNLVRVTVDARPMQVATGAGQVDPASTLRFGTLAPGSGFAKQSASGIGADAQISGEFFGLHLGMSPEGFLVKNFTGGLRFTPGNGPITLLVDRDNMRDSFLSYAGSRDPGTGRVWGGVVADTAALIGNWGDERSGFYTRVGYQIITGKEVETNHRVDANVGKYWRVFARKDNAVTIGLNATGLHYDTNLRYFTLGQGGYFSPQEYILFNVPVRWTGVYRQRLQYVVSASLGAQHFNESDSLYFPTQPLLQAKSGDTYAGQVSTGANYNFDARASYQLTPNWFIGGYVNANNARYYSSETAGFFLKYSFEARPLDQNTYVPSVPDWKGQQPFRIY